MSTAGQAIGGVIGAVAGFFMGNPMMGAQIGMMVGGYLDPPKGPHTEGPRLNDLSVQTSTYGAVIPRVYGTVALYGNVFWLENNKLSEVATTESQGGKGGPVSTNTTYAYYATFAVGLCEGPISGIRRIWVGAKLIYDAGSSDIGAIIASNESAGLFTLHLGSNTQQPDARMQATLGAANTPAYRGLAYIVFNDFPLADYSNSLMGAQIKVEVCENMSDSVTLLNSINLPGIYVRPSFAAANDFVVSFSQIGWMTSGNSYSQHLIAHDLSSKTTRNIVVTNPGGGAPGIDSVHYDGGISYALLYDGNVGDLRLLRDGVFVADLRPSIGAAPNWNYAEDSFNPQHSGAQWFDRGCIYMAVNRRSAIYNSIYRWDMAASGLVGADQTASGVDETPGHPFFINVPGDGLVYALTSAKTLKTYDHDLNLLSAVTLSFLPTQYFGFCISRGNIYVAESGRIARYDLAAGVLEKQYSIAMLAWPVRMMALGELLYAQRAFDLFVFNFATLAFSSTTLGSIVQAECLSSKLLTAGDIDVTALTQTVRGYRVASVAAIRSALEPLQGAWPFDAVQHGYQIKFKPRGSASVATIPAADLDARGAGDKPGVSITNSREMDSVLPARVSIKHLDVSREYDTGEQYAERLNTEAVNIRSIDMAIVMTAGEAAGTAEMLLYLYWMERYDLSFRLPPTYNQLEPGDVITVNATEATYSLRLTAITYTQDGRLECTAKYNGVALYTPAALGEAGQSTGATLTLAGATRTELLDIPLLLDATDMPGFPVAMCGYLAGWTGGVLMRSDDAGQTWATLQGFTTPGAAIGYASNSIGAGRLDLLDNASTLTVVLTSGALSSVSELLLFGGSNHFAYGDHGRWEIIGAKTCTLQGDGSYVLTDLLRGRQGSEGACGLHVAGDKIVLLDSSRLEFVAANLNSIGQARTYRGVTAGKTLDSASDIAFTYAGVNLECLAPVYLNGNRHPSTNDWSLDWIRRTRVGGAWRDYVDATLGEATQAYEVDIFSSNTYVTLKRTLTGLATPAAAYTSAQQVTDFGSNQATLYVKVYQISANVGRGYPLTTSITR